jgi:chitin disaccharide deacetylase
MVKKLIVNADDYAHTPGISKGILDAHLKGIVTSTTVMITFPGAIAAVHDAQRLAPNLGLGLHLTLTDSAARPILPAHEIPSLVRGDGTFYPYSEWFERCDQFNPDEIVRELTAQCECFTDIAKQPPDHLDSHHHAAYRHPAAFETLVKLAEQHHISIRHYKLSGEKSIDESLRDTVYAVPERARESFIAQLKTLIETYQPRTPDYFRVEFYDQTATLGDLLLMLANLPEGITEIMCHPGYVDEYLDSTYSDKREDEVAILSHPSVKEVIQSQQIDLVTFAAVKG